MGSAVQQMMRVQSMGLKLTSEKIPTLRNVSKRQGNFRVRSKIYSILKFYEKPMKAQ